MAQRDSDVASFNAGPLSLSHNIASELGESPRRWLPFEPPATGRTPKRGGRAKLAPRTSEQRLRPAQVPCQGRHLAKLAGRSAVLCWDFLTHRRRPHAIDASLIHGNELLLERDPDYPAERRYRVPKHTLPAIMEALQDCGPALVRGGPATSADAFDSFVGCRSGPRILAAGDLSGVG